MKKMLVLLVALLPSLVFAENFLTERGRVGTVGDCIVDANVDVAFATTVAVDALAAQKIIGITAVTNLVAGDTIMIDADNSGPRREVCVVDSIATLDVTCVDDLVYAHTAVQADDIVLTNRVGPLNARSTYYLQLVTAAGVPQAGRWLLGDSYVNGEDGGIYTATVEGDPGTVVLIKTDKPYVSFKTYTNDAVVSACQIR